MTGKLDRVAAIAAAFVVSILASAQEQAPERTLEKRVAALEAVVVSLETRLEAGARSTVGNLGRIESDAAVVTRIDGLERALDGLRADLERLSRQTESALREAMQARREATAAQQLARDAANRLR